MHATTQDCEKMAKPRDLRSGGIGREARSLPAGNIAGDGVMGDKLKCVDTRERERLTAMQRDHNGEAPLRDERYSCNMKAQSQETKRGTRLQCESVREARERKMVTRITTGGK